MNRLNPLALHDAPQTQCTEHSVHYWQWPNILALDAVAIALLWQTVFANIAGLAQPTLSMRCVLGLSLWLTYTADRLLDVSKRSLDQLHSVRHRFAKRYSKQLWQLWSSALLINLTIAFTGLSGKQLQHGALLLVICLIYTGLNQKLSACFFPKEPCVAIIYTGGILIFLLPAPDIWMPASLLLLLCWINCLMISLKEQQIDKAMEVRSMAQYMPQLIPILCMLSLLMLRFTEKQWLLPLGISLAALILVHLCRKKFSAETFRVLADAALLVGPLLTFILENYSQINVM